MQRLCVMLLMVVGVPAFGSAVGKCAELVRSNAGISTRKRKGMLRVTSPALDVQGLSAMQQFRQEMHGGTSLAVTREDFLVFVLVKNGIMSQSEIHSIWNDFARLDTIGSGVLTKA